MALRSFHGLLIATQVLESMGAHSPSPPDRDAYDDSDAIATFVVFGTQRVSAWIPMTQVRSHDTYMGRPF